MVSQSGVSLVFQGVRVNATISYMDETSQCILVVSHPLDLQMA
jgi:hypothetical protein